MVLQQIINGNYFLHISLLQEASEAWVIRKQETNSGKLFLRLAFSRDSTKDLCACDRTLRKVSESPIKLGFVPALFDMINEKSLIDYDHLDYDEYCLKVASLKATMPLPIFLIVSDSEKQRITKIAREKGYNSIKILSPIDFLVS